MPADGCILGICRPGDATAYAGGFCWPCWCRAGRPGELAYYSDYVSLAGRDATGFVLFALDTNRGVDGDTFQAEHFTVLYDQHQGWVKLAGSGAYPNPGLLAAIPDSRGFRFAGTPASGLTIRSPPHNLELAIEPLPVRLEDNRGEHQQHWGSAPAQLTWQGRRIPGRVIYEYLVHRNWNRLTRTYPGSWDNFQGFYLLLDRGAAAHLQDIYLRSQGSGGARRTKGFAAVDDWSGELASPRLRELDKVLVLGFYRWPQRWEIDLAPAGEDVSAGHLQLRQLARRNIGNWVIGGFAMSVVQGELEWRGEKMRCSASPS